MLNKQKNIILIASALLFVAGLFYLSWLLYNNMLALSKIVAGAEAKVALLAKKEYEFSLIEASLKDFETDIRTLENVFVKESAFVSFVELLEGLARKSNVKFVAESAKLPQRKEEQAVITFRVEGSLQAINNFLALLDNMPFSGLVENLTIIPKQERGKKTGTLEARINYFIFNFIP